VGAKKGKIGGAKWGPHTQTIKILMKMMSAGTGNNVFALPMKMTHPCWKSGEKWEKLWLRLNNVTAEGRNVAKRGKLREKRGKCACNCDININTHIA